MDLRSLLASASSHLAADGHPTAAAAICRAGLVPPPSVESYSLLDTHAHSKAIAPLVRGSRTIAEGAPPAPHQQSALHISPSASVDPTFGFHAPPDDRDYTFTPEAALRVAKTSPRSFEPGPLIAGTAKKAIRCVAFSPDGALSACGSGDASVRVFDVNRLVRESNIMSGSSGTSGVSGAEQHGGDDSGEKVGRVASGAGATARMYFDHAEDVEDIAFHPAHPVLASCSRDATIRFYDLSQATHRRSFRHITDTEPLRSIAWHPAGMHLYAAADSPTIRIWDVNTMRSWGIGGRDEQHPSALARQEHHSAPVHIVRMSWRGSTFATASRDGTAKIWDSKTNRCVMTLPKCHGGAELSTLQFTRSDGYLLTSGRDGFVRVWDLSTGRTVVELVAGGKARSPTPSCWSYSEEHIFVNDGTTDVVQVWDSRTGEQVSRLGGHVHDVRALIASPTDDYLLTGGADSRVRLWVAEQPAQLYQWPTPVLLTTDSSIIAATVGNGGAEHSTMPDTGEAPVNADSPTHTPKKEEESSSMVKTEPDMADASTTAEVVHEPGMQTDVSNSSGPATEPSPAGLVAENVASSADAAGPRDADMVESNTAQTE